MYYGKQFSTKREMKNSVLLYIWHNKHTWPHQIGSHCYDLFEILDLGFHNRHI